MIVPEKYNAKYQDRYRQVKYEWYLTRGLPIPKEYMPKTPGRSAGEDREGEGEGIRGGVGEGKQPFEPRIAMRVGGDGRERMIKCIFFLIWRWLIISNVSG